MSIKPIRIQRTALIATTLMLVAALTAGCQNLIPGTASIQPATAAKADSTCVAHCELKKSQCEQRQLLREQDCQQSKTQIAAEQPNCSPKEGPLCVQALECLGADLGICLTEFELCVAECPSGVTTQTPEADEAASDPS